MSNCHLVAGTSLIDLVASRLALRAPALCAATALTWPNRSAQRLPCGRRAAPTAVTVDPGRTVAEHGVERGDHLTHHRHDDDLRLLSGGLEAIVECFEPRIPIKTIDSKKLALMELEGWLRIPRLRIAERGVARWQDGGKRSIWR